MKIALTVVIIISSIFSAAASTLSTGDDMSRFETIRTGDEDFDKTFRQGRELLAKEDFSGAAAKFTEIVCDCPEKKGVDAALYWLAFCYMKLGKTGEMDATIDRLQRSFPSSSWNDDARVLRVRAANFASTTSPVNANLSQQALGLAYVDQNIPLEREEEIRLAAFQSLFASDPSRAVTILGDIVMPNSKTSENLQVQMLRTVRRSGFDGLTLTTGSYSQSSELASITTSPGASVLKSDSNMASRIAINKQLAEVLTAKFPAVTSLRVRKEMINVLASFEDGIDRLGPIYTAETDVEIKKTILSSLGTMFSPLKQDGSRKKSVDMLLGIIRDENNPALKIEAIRSIGSFGVGVNGDQLVDIVGKLYSNESDDEMKSALISVLVRARSPRANARLIEIARSDRSDKIRLEAIRSLRGSNDPQVLKFLEELVR